MIVYNNFPQWMQSISSPYFQDMYLLMYNTCSIAVMHQPNYHQVKPV